MLNSNFLQLKESRRTAIQKSPLFSRDLELNREELTLIFGQYWHLLAYFPDFLAHLITLLPKLEQKSAVARILSEELGNGNIQDAHEGAYFEAIRELGIDENQIRNSTLLPSTEAMMREYHSCATDRVKALGYFASTEFADLWIVSNLGRLMLNALPERKRVKWIDLHVTQEPGHVTDAGQSLKENVEAAELPVIFQHAQNCATRWDDFFVGIYEAIQSDRLESVS